MVFSFIITNIIYVLLSSLVCLVYYLVDFNRTNDKSNNSSLELMKKSSANINFDMYINDIEETNENNHHSIDNGILLIISQIKQECLNFLHTEFKIIIIYSVMLSFIFYILIPKNISLEFCGLFLFGITISYLTSYFATVLSVESIKYVLQSADKSLNSALSVCIDKSSKIAILLFIISFLGYYLTLILLHFWQNPEPNQVSKLAYLPSSKKSPVCTAAGRL